MAITPSNAGPLISSKSGEGYIVAYDVADCGNTGVLGTTTDKKTIVLPQGVCVQVSGIFLRGVMSFQGGSTVVCPNGKTGTILVYQSADCSVNSVEIGADAGMLPAVGPGDCKNILPMGESAIFSCV